MKETPLGGDSMAFLRNEILVRQGFSRARKFPKLTRL